MTSAAPGTAAGATHTLLRTLEWRSAALAFTAAYATGALCALLVRAAGWWHGAPWEVAALTAVQRTVHPAFDLVMLSLPFFGTNYTLAPLSIIVAAWLWRRGLVMAALHLLTVQAGSWLLNPLLKFSFPRDRPALFEARGQFAFPAFPSGHAIASVSVLLTAAFLLHRYAHVKWGYVVAGGVILLNAWSRVYLSVHWPTDVLAGLAVGAVWLLWTLHIFRRHHPI